MALNAKSTTARRVSGAAGADLKDLAWVRPIERKKRLYDVDVRASLYASAKYDGCIVQSRPIANDEIGDLTQLVGHDGFLAAHPPICKRMTHANDIARASLVACHQVEVSEVVTAQALVSGDPRRNQNDERGAWKPSHLDLVGG